MSANIEFGFIVNDEVVTIDSLKSKDAQIDRLLRLLDKSQEMIRNRRESYDSMKRTYQAKVDRLTHDALYWKRQYDRMIGEYEKI